MNAGGDLDDLIEDGDIQNIEKMPAHNLKILEKLQETFDDCIQILKMPEKAYKIGERLLLGYSYYAKRSKNMPDVQRVLGINYLFMDKC